MCRGQRGLKCPRKFRFGGGEVGVTGDSAGVVARTFGFGLWCFMGNANLGGPSYLERGHGRDWPPQPGEKKHAFVHPFPSSSTPPKYPVRGAAPHTPIFTPKKLRQPQVMGGGWGAPSEGVLGGAHAPGGFSGNGHGEPHGGGQSWLAFAW